jgi:ABC-2 type transport system ATP-binding protein
VNDGSGRVTVHDLTKRFGTVTAVAGLTFAVEPGRVTGFLGPNGSGKTTTVRILSTLITADGGEVEVLGHDVRRAPNAVRRGIGVTGQFSAVDDLLTGRENLRLMADLHHLPRGDRRARVEFLLETFGLGDAADRRVATYSGGMKRRLDLAMTLVGSPRLIFLDEPTTGLDPRSRIDLWQIVRSLVADGVTVFLTTQYLEEADRLADLVGVLDGGRLVGEGTPAELKQQTGAETMDDVFFALTGHPVSDETADAGRAEGAA